MKVKCCSVWQSTNDPETYLAFDKYEVKPLTKTHVAGKKVTQEIVYSFSCLKCGGCKVKVIRTGRILGKKTILETENHEYDDALDYLVKTAKARTHIEIQNPAKPPVIIGKFIPMAYWKREDAFTQRKRYLNESDYVDKFERIEIVRGVEKTQWSPDIVKPEVKISKYKNTKIS